MRGAFSQACEDRDGEGVACTRLDVDFADDVWGWCILDSSIRFKLFDISQVLCGSGRLGVKAQALLKHQNLSSTQMQPFNESAKVTPQRIEMDGGGWWKIVDDCGSWYSYYTWYTMDI